ncbi:clusterin [Struthio camelus]|uniref:clusterin n=1 Tax=Struthio camelus TaxID=8801 RepID=UPI0036041E64
MAPLALSLLAALLACGGGRALVPPGELKQMSVAGSERIGAELEAAVDGVKRMKTLMERSSREHRAVLHALQETKRRKEEAVRAARAAERRLAEEREPCNDTMLALWDECKPCLKRTCMRLYSKTCHSGSGLLGRQLEELLNRSSPSSLWADGERVAALLERDRWQERRFEDLQERFGRLEDGVDRVFRRSAPVGRAARDLHPFVLPPHLAFHRLFQPLLEMTQRVFEDAQRDFWRHPFESFAPPGSRNASDERMVCREIRRHSAGCLRMSDECEKCREILAADCWQADPEQSQLREQFEDAVRLAERFSRRYDDLLGTFQADVLNVTGLLEELHRRFGWLSRLANVTQHDDGFLQVTTVLSKAPNPQDPSAPPDTQVTVQLFDSEPLVLTVPGDIAWDDPRFMELVAEQALQHYKQNAIE